MTLEAPTNLKCWAVWLVGFQSLRVQVLNTHVRTQNLYYNYYYPKTQVPNHGVLGPSDFTPCAVACTFVNSEELNSPESPPEGFGLRVVGHGTLPVVSRFRVEGLGFTREWYSLEGP